MAYLRALVKKCESQGCTRPAIYTVVNRYNAEQGDYCSHDAKLKLRELLAGERAAEEAKP